jgi:hypothetical protein
MATLGELTCIGSGREAGTHDENTFRQELFPLG